MTISSPRRRNPAPFLRLPVLTAGVIVTGMLAGCGDDSMNFAPTCPIVEIPPAAADYYLYESGRPDLSHLQVKAGLTSLTGECHDAAKEAGIRNRISVSMNVTRGPGTGDANVTLPFFVAVVHNDRIIDKKIFSHTVTFPPNLYQTNSSTEVLTIDLPETAKRDAQGYRLEVGFQLTAQQLQYNRTHLVAPTFVQK